MFFSLSSVLFFAVEESVKDHIEYNNLAFNLSKHTPKISLSLYYLCVDPLTQDTRKETWACGPLC